MPTFMYIGSGIADSPFWAGTDATAATQSVFTFADFNIGAADADRYVIVSAVASGASHTCDTVTIGGVSAGRVVESVNTSGVTQWIANVPSGTTADIVVTYSTNVSRCRIGVWVSYTPGLVAIRPKASSNASTSYTLSDVTVQDGGFLISAVYGSILSTTVTTSWTGADSIVERYDNFLTSGSSAVYFSDIAEITETSDTLDISGSFSGSQTHFETACGYIGRTGSPYTPVLVDSATDSSNLTTYTFTNRNIGTADANRQLVICISWANSIARSPSTCTVGGNSATLVGSASNAGIWRIPYPTGTTADIVIGMSGGCTNMAIGVYDTRPRGTFYPTDVKSASSTGTTISASNLGVRDDGFVVGVGRCAADSNTPSVSYNGVDTLTVDTSNIVETDQHVYISGNTTETNDRNDLGITTSASSVKRMIFASFA